MDLKATASESAAGDDTTWGEVDKKHPVEVDKDPLMRHTFLEEGDPSEQPTPRREVAPLARRSSDAFSPLLMHFAG